MTLAVATGLLTAAAPAGAAYYFKFDDSDGVVAVPAENTVRR